MFPVLFTIGKIPVSSFGVFLSLGFLLGVFLIWRISRAWDLDEEKILDLTLFTFLGGLIGARIYFVIEHFQVFSQNLPGIFFFNKIPGFSFWGAVLGGWLMLFFLVKGLLPAVHNENFLILALVALFLSLYLVEFQLLLFFLIAVFLFRLLKVI